VVTLIKNAFPPDAAKDIQEKVQRKMAELLNGRQDKKVYVQVSGPDWASARRKLDQYLDRTKTLAGQPAFQDTRKRLPAQATVLHFIEMATYGQIMAEFMQTLMPTSAKIPPADTSRTGYFGAAITFEPGRGKLDVWLPAAGIRAFYLPVEILIKAMELEPAVPEPPEAPKKERKPNFEPKSDQEAIQGIWNVVDAFSAGEKVANVHKMNLVFVFEGNSWKTCELGKVKKAGARGTFKLDPGKKPKAIDLNIIGAKGTQRGIYELEESKLKLCLPIHAEQERPRHFTSTKENNCSIWFLERKK
jgi:uncharacterized protein (TIGR03067 family)